MASKVYLYDRVSDLQSGVNRALKLASRELGGGKVGLKVNFGELGCTTHVKPGLFSDINEYFSDPSFVECNVLYRGMRTTACEHQKLARDHGFGFIPCDILDGEKGEDIMEVPLDGEDEPALLGGGLARYDSLIAVSHFKGHLATGFAGSLKNLGMGLGARPGKLWMHSIVSPNIQQDKCVACGVCIKNCPAAAIDMTQKKLLGITTGKRVDIKSDKCIGCARCITVCPHSAINLPWGFSREVNDRLMERIALYAKAATCGRKWMFMNFVTDITYDCDCHNEAQTPFMADIGIVFGDDIVAVEQASLDLVKEKNGGADPFREKHGIDGAHILEYAEMIGLGSREYEFCDLPA
ncbi:DUF362 domain-containing protein [Candidatus Altiarchaeota archaeon]